MTITHADGSADRWAWDELKAENVPSALTFGTSVPGGNKDLTLTLPRRIDREYADVALFDDVRVWGPANETVWNGYVVQIPRSHSDTTTLQVGCVGYAGMLRFNPFFREVYIDRDLSHWEEPSLQRKIDLMTASPAQQFQGSWALGGQDAGSAAPGITQEFTRLVTVAATGPFALVETWYYSQGPALSEIRYDFDSVTGIGSTTDWDNQAFLSSDDLRSASDAGTDHANVDAANQSLTTTATNRRYAMVRIQHHATVTGDSQWTAQWKNVRTFGTHGLTKQTDSSTGADGFYASDVVADIVSRAAPLLSYTTGSGGSIQATTFVIPQLEFRDPVTAEDAILRTNAYHLWEWGVYGGPNDPSGYPAKTFFFRPPDPNRCQWEARLSEGAHLDLEGDQADTVYNGVVVTWTDTGGKLHTLGPPGSGADATDSLLADTSASNPINAHGIPARYAQLQITPVTTQTGALQIGQVFLAEQSLPQRRGQLTVRGTLQHPTQGRRPVWQVRAGDFVRLPDHPTDVPRRVIETSYNHDSQEMTMSLDNSANKLEAILERFGLALGVAANGSVSSGGTRTPGPPGRA